MDWNQLRSNRQGFCSSTLGRDSTPKQEVMATEHRSPGSHLTLALAAPSPALALAKVVAASSPIKATEHMQTA